MHSVLIGEVSRSIVANTMGAGSNQFKFRWNVVALLNAGLLCIIAALILRLWKMKQTQKVVIYQAPAKPKAEMRTAAFQVPEEQSIVVNISDLDESPTTVVYDLIARKKHHHHF